MKNSKDGYGGGEVVEKEVQAPVFGMQVRGYFQCKWWEGETQCSPTQ